MLLSNNSFSDLEVAEKKAIQAANKAKREEEKAQRAAAFQKRREDAAVAKEKKAQEMEARKLAREAARAEKELQTTAKSPTKRSKKALEKAKMPEAIFTDAVAPVEEEEAIPLNSRGRRIQPHRFLKVSLTYIYAITSYMSVLYHAYFSLFNYYLLWNNSQKGRWDNVLAWVSERSDALVPVDTSLYQCFASCTSY